MPTAKKRINITVSDELYRSLSILSQKEHGTLSGVSLRLIEKAIELEEDSNFANQADERLEGKSKRVPHAKAWDL